MPASIELPRRYLPFLAVQTLPSDDALLTIADLAFA